MAFRKSFPSDNSNFQAKTILMKFMARTRGKGDFLAKNEKTGRLSGLERVRRIGLPYRVWKTRILPLNYTRTVVATNLRGLKPLVSSCRYRCFLLYFVQANFSPPRFLLLQSYSYLP